MNLIQILLEYKYNKFKCSPKIEFHVLVIHILYFSVKEPLDQSNVDQRSLFCQGIMAF